MPEPTTAEPMLMTPREAAGELRVSTRTLSRLKDLPRVSLGPRIVRYDRAELQQYIRSRQCVGQS